jgi:hypothetical protein
VWVVWSRGWERHHHWVEGAIWVLSVGLGLTSAVGTVRGASKTPNLALCGVAALLLLGHLLSGTVLIAFVFMEALGGPR